MKDLKIENNKSGETMITFMVPEYKEKQYKLSEVQSRCNELCDRKIKLQDQLEAVETELSTLEKVLKKANG